MAALDPRDEQIERLRAQLADSARTIEELRARLARSSLPPSRPPSSRAPSSASAVSGALPVGTLELTLQSTTSDEVHRLVVEWSRPGQLPLRCERPVTIDETQLLAANARSYGALLGRALFEGDARDLFAQARADESPLRVLLAVEARKLQTLRWERLCGPFDDGRWEPLGLNQRAPFSLYLPSTTDRRFRPFGRGDLKALVVVAAPLPDCTFVAHFDEEAALQSVLAGLGDIPSRVLGKTAAAEGPPTLTEICRQLTAERFTLLHIVCHGAFARDGETAVFLDGDGGGTTPVRASEMIEQLRRVGGEHGLPHFAFLAVCDSAKPEAEGALGGLAQRLVREVGMPAVVAMTERISQATALALGTEFYPRLRDHGEVDRALAEACVAVRTRHDVAVPVPALFSRLGGRPLFADSPDAPLGPREIRAGLARLDALFEARAPVLLEAVRRHAAELLTTADCDPATLAADAGSARGRSLDELDRLCVEVLELPFAALARGAAPPEYRADCPFPGLRAFSGAERRFFHGRKALVAALVERLETQPLMPVLGSSGSGKSSVVMAGVIPTLQDRQPSLQVAQMKPGDDPLARLEAALGALGDAPDTLLYIDQFEEVFTRCSDAKERRAFLDAMLARARPRHRVVLTMRADFFGECAAHAGLREVVQQRAQFVAPMTPEELRGAVEEQAAEAGLRFEAGLCEAILQDLLSEPGAMPLLQHALRELWDRRHGRWLRLASYVDEIGRVKGAIAKTADRVMDSLDAGERARVKSMMKKLTHIGAAGGGAASRDTRKRVPLRNLCSDAAGEALVARLAGEGARLLVTSHDASADEDLVEVAHEALIREWPTLQRWLNEARYGLQLAQQVEDAAAHWRENGLTDDYLQHRGVRGEVVRGMVQRGVIELDADQDAYLQACEAGDQRRQREREEEAARLAAAYEESRTRLLASYEEQGRSQSLAGFWEPALLFLHAAYQGGRREPSTRFLLARAAWETMDVMVARLGGPEHQVCSAAFTQDGTRAMTGALEGAVRLWDAATGELVSTFEALPGVPFAMFGIGDGPEVLVAGAAGDLRKVGLWHVPSGGCIAMFEGHEGDVNSRAFSADLTRFVTASDDGTARVWDTESGDCLRTLVGHEGPVNTAAFDLERARVVTAGADKTAKIWDAATGACVVTLQGHKGSVVSASFSSDGCGVVTASHDNTVGVWDSSTFERVPPLEIPGLLLQWAAIGPDMKRIVTAGADGLVRLWDWTTAKMLATLRGHRAQVFDAGFNRDGTRVLSTGHDRRAILWRSAGGELVTVLEGHTASVCSATFAPKGARVLTASHDATARLWDAASGALLATLEGHGEALNAAAFDPDGARVLTASDDGTARLWDVATGEALAELTGHQGSVTSAVFSLRGARALTAGKDQTPRLWDATTATLVAPLEGHTATVNSAVFSRDGARVVTASKDKTARLWDAVDGAFLVALEGHEREVTSAVFSPDSARVVTASDDETARLWDATTGALLATLKGHTQAVVSAEFDVHGTRVLTISHDYTGRLWDAKTGAPLATLLGHEHGLSAARFSPDGAFVATASLDATARLWDATTGLLLATFGGRGSSVVVSVNFNPDGTRLVTASEDGTARVWDIHRETRDPEVLDRLIREKLSVRLEGGRVVEATSIA